MEEKTEQSLVFRYIGISTEQGEIAGLCLCFEKHSIALSVFEEMYAYLSAPASRAKKRMRVEFSHDCEFGYKFEIEFGTGDSIRRIEIHGIESSYIDRLKQSIRVFSYYAILAGFINDQGNFELLPVKDYHLFRSEVVIDGKVLHGNSMCKFDWEKVFSDRQNHIYK